MHSIFIKRAIELADNNIDSGGGPFGAVIVREGKIIAEASNKVTRDNDPTAHAEVMAIRLAGSILKSFDLSDCILYASCEPCPMCLGAIYWSRISTVYYAADREDAMHAGFSDKMIYDELSKPMNERNMQIVQIEPEATITLFKKWKLKSDKKPY